jgi:hypothetical protein
VGGHWCGIKFVVFAPMTPVIAAKQKGLLEIVGKVDEG